MSFDPDYDEGSDSCCVCEEVWDMMSLTECTHTRADGWGCAVPCYICEECKERAEVEEARAIALENGEVPGP